MGYIHLVVLAATFFCLASEAQLKPWRQVQMYHTKPRHTFCAGTGC